MGLIQIICAEIEQRDNKTAEYRESFDTDFGEPDLSKHTV